MNPPNSLRIKELVLRVDYHARREMCAAVDHAINNLCWDASVTAEELDFLRHTLAPLVTCIYTEGKEMTC